MPPHDLPLWARGVAGLLLVVASWWAAGSEPLRRLVGDSVGLVCLGVLAAFVLRGMHLPLGIWPDGPWRGSFSVPRVLGVAVVFAVVVVVSQPARSSALPTQLDRGMYLTAAAGVAGWGLAVGVVRQRPYIAWFVAAAAAAMLPWAVVVTGGWSWAGEAAVDVRELAFTTAVAAPSALVTLELGFRRLLIGRGRGAGLILVLGSAAVSLAWRVLMGLGGLGQALWPFAGAAVSAGGLYALSGSLLVSSLYTALATAGLREFPGAATGASALLVGHVAVAVSLAAVVLWRHGLWGGIQRGGAGDAARR